MTTHMPTLNCTYFQISFSFSCIFIITDDVDLHVPHNINDYLVAFLIPGCNMLWLEDVVFIWIFSWKSMWVYLLSFIVDELRNHSNTSKTLIPSMFLVISYKSLPHYCFVGQCSLSYSHERQSRSDYIISPFSRKQLVMLLANDNGV